MIISALEQARDFGQLSLYIHIPFCARKCDYCDFYSRTDMTGELLDAYSDHLCREISFITDRYPLPFTSVFIGGGNPGLLGPERLQKILKASHRHGRPAECSIEINPESIDAALLTSAIGMVDRLSIGVQSLKQKNLRTLGRNATAEQTLDGLRRFQPVREHFALNIDLIQGVPSQGADDTLEDITELQSLLHPDHFSIYDLIIEEGTPLHTRVAADRSIETDVNGNVLISCSDVRPLLSSLGFSRYEIANYAKAHRQCLHNLHYWQLLPYVGIGAGASSTLYTDTRVLRLHGRENLHAYAYESSSFSDTIYEMEQLSAQEFLEEILLMGLRTTAGVSLHRLRDCFGCDLQDVLKQSLPVWEARGCLQICDDHLSLSEKGMDLLNSILIDMFMDIESFSGTLLLALDTDF
jgi:oxygen-independent coproporphyrinogen III oxidase